jgi:hypothetical protein
MDLRFCSLRFRVTVKVASLTVGCRATFQPGDNAILLGSRRWRRCVLQPREWQGPTSSTAASPIVELPVATVGNGRSWRPLLLAQGAVGRGWAKVSNLAVTGRSTTHDGRRHPTHSGRWRRRNAGGKADKHLAWVAGLRSRAYRLDCDSTDGAHKGGRHGTVCGD